MATTLQKYQNLDEVQMQGMINYSLKKFPYLEYSSMEVLTFFCQRMAEVEFMSEKKPTPLRSSLEFLRSIIGQALSKKKQLGEPVPGMFAERDFVFAIKMFGLYVRSHGGLKQFVPEEEREHSDEVVLIDSAEDAKRLEFYVSDIHKYTKIQTHAIESATNRLLRVWREIELAKIFSEKISREKMTVGQAQAYLHDEFNIEAHEFVRIRKHALARGWFSSKRRASKINRRVTLDDDTGLFVEDLMMQFSSGAKFLTMSQTVNKALRDFRTLTRVSGVLSKPATVASKAAPVSEIKPPVAVSKTPVPASKLPAAASKKPVAKLVKKAKK